MATSSRSSRFERQTVLTCYLSYNAVECRNLGDLQTVTKVLSPRSSSSHQGLCFLERLTRDVVVGTFYDRPYRHQVVSIDGLLLRAQFDTGHSDLIHQSVRVDDCHIASGSKDGTCRVVDARDGSIVSYDYPSWVNCVTPVSADGRLICGGGGDEYEPLHCWDRETGAVVARVDSQFDARVMIADADPSSGVLYCGSVRGECAMHDLRLPNSHGVIWQEGNVATSSIRSIRCAPLSHSLLLKQFSGDVIVRDVRSLDRIVRRLSPNAPGYGSIISVDEEDIHFLSGSNLLDLEELRQYQEKSSGVQKCSLSHWTIDGKILESVEGPPTFGIAVLGDAELKELASDAAERVGFVSEIVSWNGVVRFFLDSRVVVRFWISLGIGLV